MQPPGIIPLELSVLRFSGQRENQGVNHFNLRAASKFKFLILHVDITSRKIEKKQIRKKRKNEKLKTQQPSSLTFAS